MNNHKANPFIVGGELTGWMFTDAVRQYKCPKCGSDPGYRCQGPSTRAMTPHFQRTSLLVAEVGIDAFSIPIAQPA